ncbi:MAG: N-acetylglucosamine-6-phosphate deacetylase [Chitinophagaceae bacterium]|nr:MAG: N-acetylglucosamine-6-phosphate deacetylase [Chitinophagaceae bacterium]
MPIAYTNARILSGENFEDGKAVLTDMGIITDIVPHSDIPGGYTQTDLDGLNLAPALIDLQIYGGHGKMFSDDPGIAPLEAIYNYSLEGGASHFMVTMATNSIDTFLRGIEAVRSYWKSGGKGLLGLHLEGPYLNPVKKGAHLEQYIKPPTMDEVKMLMDTGGDVIKMITIAPEVCSQEVICYLTENVPVVSAGHTNATYKQAQHGFGLGIPAATHLYNAMSGLQHREPGMVGAVFNDANVLSSIVCDGIHVDFAAVRIAKKIMQKRLFYITDAVAATDGPGYQHRLAGDRYTLPDGTLSGSALTMMQCVKNGIEKVGITPEESLRMGSEYPGSLLRRDIMLGRIAKDYAAKFVVFNNDYVVVRVIR